MALQDNVTTWGEVPKTTLDGSEQDRPEGVLELNESLTIPESPLKPVRVIVEALDTPGPF